MQYEEPSRNALARIIAKLSAERSRRGCSLWWRHGSEDMGSIGGPDTTSERCNHLTDGDG